MKTKQKQQLKTNITAEAAAQAAIAYTNSQHVIDKKQTAMDSELAEAKQRIEQKYAPVIKECRELQAEATDVLKTYAEQERSTWTGKSSVLGSLTLSFRSGARAVQLAKGLTAEKAVERLKTAGLKRFLRAKYELNKPAMLEVTKESVINQLAECGIGFGNSETFYIEVG